VVVLDSSLADLPEVAEGVKDSTRVLLNSGSDEKVGSCECHSFDATKLAISKIGKPIVNTAMLGALIKMTGLASLGSLKKVTGKRFPGKVGDLNMEMVEDAYKAYGD